MSEMRLETALLQGRHQHSLVMRAIPLQKSSHVHVSFYVLVHKLAYNHVAR